MPLDFMPYLEVESQIQSVVFNKAEARINKAIEEIQGHIEKNDKDGAINALFAIDFKDDVAAVDGEIDFFLINCLMVGSSFASPLRESHFLEENSLPKFMPQVKECFGRMYTEAARDYMREKGSALIEGTFTALQKAEGKGYKKAVDLDFANELNAAVLGGARIVNDIGANLTTSRLVAYGFLAEASMKGIKKYQLQAVLDQVTSEVCKKLHGLVFNVEISKSFLEEVLQVTDPAELAAMNPFVSGNKATLYELENLSATELQARGVMVPPFHPHCRTILVPRGTVDATGSYKPVEILISEKKNVLPFASQDGFYKWAGKQAVELTEKETVATALFQQSNSINKILRETKVADLDKQDKSFIRSLDNAINAHEFNKDTVLYRTVKSKKTFGVDDLLDLEGATIRDKGYVSTSAMEKNAILAASTYTKGVLIEIVVPAGANYVVPGVHTLNKKLMSEAEVVLGRGSKFLVSEIIPKYKKIKTPSGSYWLPKVIMKWYK